MAGRLERLRASPVLAWLALALFALLAADLLRSLPETQRLTLLDFPAYRSAGRHALSGEPELLYRSDKYFTNLPLVALLLAPLAKLSYPTAWRVFWWLELASFAATFALLLLAIRRFLPPLSVGRAGLAGIVFLAFAPLLRRCLVLGQTTPMLVLCFAGFYWLLRSGRARAAGLLLGWICLWKVPPLLLIPLLWLRRRRAAALSALAVLAGGVGLSWLAFGGEVMRQYADTVVWENLGRSVSAFNNRSLDGVFTRLLGDGSLVDWTPSARPLAVTLAVGATALALVVWTLAHGRGLWLPAAPPSDGDPRRGSLELELLLGTALMLLVLPIAWIHYYLFLAVPLTLLPFWWLARGLPLRGWLLAAFALASWCVSGQEVAGNDWYAARDADWLLRARLAAQPLGAALLVACSATALRELAGRAGRPARSQGSSTPPRHSSGGTPARSSASAR